jgi:4-carboxymuconolactone decarboxylase
MVKNERYKKGLEVAYKIWGKKFVDETLKNLRKINRDLEKYLVEYAFGEIYGRPKLDEKTRILCTITALAALGKENQLKWHILGGLKNGIPKEEIVETLIHVSVYAGFPAAWNALRIAQQAFKEYGKEKTRK